MHRLCQFRDGRLALELAPAPAQRIAVWEESCWSKLLSSGRCTTTKIAANATMTIALRVPTTHANAWRRRARLPEGSKKIGLPSMGAHTVRVSAIHSSPPDTRIYSCAPFAFQCHIAAFQGLSQPSRASRLQHPACAALLPPAIKAPMTSNEIRMFMMTFSSTWSSTSIHSVGGGGEGGGLIERIQAMIFQRSSEVWINLPMAGIGPFTLPSPKRW